MKAIRIEDIAEYKFLSNLCYSPDGKHVAVTVAKAELKENGYRKYIYVADSKSMKFKKLTNGGAEGMFIWRDNNTIVFPRITEKADKELLSSGEELSVFYSIDINGGEATEIFRAEAMVTSIKKLGDDFVLTAKHDIARPNLTGLKDDKRREALQKHKAETEDFTVADELPFWFNGMGFINKQRNAVYIYNIKAKELKAITEENFNASKVEISPDEDFLIITGLSFDKYHYRGLDGIYKYDIKKEEMVSVLDSGKYGVDKIGIMGDKVIFLASHAKDEYEFVSPDFYTAEIHSHNKVKKLMDYDGDFGCQTGTDCSLGGGTNFKVVGESLYIVDTENSMPAIVEIKNGKAHSITDRSLRLDSFDIHDGKCICVAMSDVSLQEVYTVSLESGERKKISSFNQKSLDGKYTAPCNPLSFVNKDGVTIDGWVLLPKDYDESKKYPGVLEIHGGPRGTYGKVFYHEMQVMASDGCFVFFCNPRGSSSKGNAFANIAGKYGTVDYEDIMEFTDKVLEKYSAIDKSRLAVGGGSYGGYMTNWIIGHTDRFKAASSQRSVTNWGAFNLVSDIGGYFGKREQQGDVWSDNEKLWEHSPLKYANKAVTPTLFIHSFEDYRCWRPESEQMYRALLNNKVPSRICFFKGENHELSRSGKPKHRIRRLKEITTWFYTYIKE